MGLLGRLTGAKAMAPAAAAAGAADGTLVLVDVREPHEFAAGHAPGARHVPLSRLPGELDALARAGTPVAFVCASGMRSARATRMARGAGVDARNVKGGMLAWQRQDLPVTTTGARRRRAR